MTEFSITMKKLRISRNLNARELSSLLNISPSFLSLIEKGERTIPDDFINNVERILSLTDSERIELINAKAALNIPRKENPTPTREIKKEAEKLLNELYMRVEMGSAGNDLVDGIISKIKQMNERAMLKAA